MQVSETNMRFLKFKNFILRMDFVFVEYIKKLLTIDI